MGGKIRKWMEESARGNIEDRKRDIRWKYCGRWWFGEN